MGSQIDASFGGSFFENVSSNGVLIYWAFEGKLKFIHLP